MHQNKVIIFGNTKFSSLIARYIIDCGEMEIVCFTVDKDYIKEKSILNIPVVPYENVVNDYPHSKYSIILALGYNKMNSLREAVYNRLKKDGYTIKNFIHPNSTIHSDIKGEGNIIMDDTHISYNCLIGNCNIIWHGTHIGHDAQIGDFNHFCGSTLLGGDSKVGDKCFFGNNCSTINGIKIENSTLVGANCCLTRDTKPFEAYCAPKPVLMKRKSNDIVI